MRWSSRLEGVGKFTIDMVKNMSLKRWWNISCLQLLTSHYSTLWSEAFKCCGFVVFHKQNSKNGRGGWVRVKKTLLTLNGVYFWIILSHSCKNSGWVWVHFDQGELKQKPLNMGKYFILGNNICFSHATDSTSRQEACDAAELVCRFTYITQIKDPKEWNF